jgi:hypothetical protein
VSKLLMFEVKGIQLVFAASPLSSKNNNLCLNEITCLLTDCCFNELACLSCTKQTSSPSCNRVKFFCHDIAEQIAQTSIT